MDEPIEIDKIDIGKLLNGEWIDEAPMIWLIDTRTHFPTNEVVVHYTVGCLRKATSPRRVLTHKMPADLLQTFIHCFDCSCDCGFADENNPHV